jgi:SAM-dependent methyltransferase
MSLATRLNDLLIIRNPLASHERPPPELVAIVDGPDSLPPGRALDLGCGTGTSAIYLASRGWEVTGVDHAGRALHTAGHRADAAGVAVWFVPGDVTRLPDLRVGAGYGLLLDISCFHGLPDERRDAYAAGATAAALPAATFLMHGLGEGALRPGWRGVSADELKRRFKGWDLLDATRSPGRLEAWWFRLKRRP